jgi:predicted amidohydrolase YtcJ
MSINISRHSCFVILILAAAAAAISSGAFSRSDVVISPVFCAYGPSAASVSAVFPPPLASEPADLLLLNGDIYTGDPARRRVEAVAVTGDRIVAIGSSKEIRAQQGPKTRVVDLHGDFAMPGFNDAHTHLGGAGQARLTIDLEGAASLAEFQQRIRAHLGDYKPGEWITGRGWDHTLWPEKRFPSRQDLDVVSKDHPMFFGRVDGHVAVANSRALEIAGITRDTKDPLGSNIERDEAGEPTGMLKESAAMGLVRSKIPPPSPEQRRRGIELVLDDAARHGVTSLQDNSSWEDFLVYEQIRNDGRLTARITEWLPFTAPLDKLDDMRRCGGTSDLMLRTGALKLVADGSLGSRTAALLAPYSDDPSTSGMMILDPDEITKMVIERDKAGYQIAIHAIGDRTNRVVLDAFAAARATASSTRRSSHRKTFRGSRSSG